MGKTKTAEEESEMLYIETTYTDEVKIRKTSIDEETEKVSTVTKTEKKKVSPQEERILNEKRINEEEITRLFRVRTTALQMLRDRGYYVHKSRLNMTRPRFVQEFGKADTIVLNDSPTQGGGEEDPTYIVVKRQNIAIRARKKEVVNKKKAKANEDSDEEFRDDEIHVYFHDKEVASAKIIKHYIDTVKNSGVLRAILVSQVMKLSAAAKKSIDKKNAQYFHFELFEEKELIANITEHHLVPKHKVLSTEEKQELLDRYTSHETQLPRMLITDPISRYYGLTRGQVVKITRKSDTAGEYETYRIVV